MASERKVVQVGDAEWELTYPSASDTAGADASIEEQTAGESTQAVLANEQGAFARVTVVVRSLEDGDCEIRIERSTDDVSERDLLRRAVQELQRSVRLF